MGKNKLKKFNEMKGFHCVVEAPFNVYAGFTPNAGTEANSEAEINAASSSVKPELPDPKSIFAHPALPLILELGCGKGEYTVGLAKHDPSRNYMGVDIKGARIYTGACQVEEEGIPNAGFLRTHVEALQFFFGKDEVDALWITFPDPQLKKTNKRLTSTRFLGYYRKFVKPDGLVCLKTDSPFLYEYTLRLAQVNGLEILEATPDLYAREGDCLEKSIKTFYEQQWLSRGKSIKLLKFRIGSSPLQEPDVSDLEPDDYRAAARFNRQ